MCPTPPAVQGVQGDLVNVHDEGTDAVSAFIRRIRIDKLQREEKQEILEVLGR
jgi:hypothetical protein